MDRCGQPDLPSFPLQLARNSLTRASTSSPLKGGLPSIRMLTAKRERARACTPSTSSSSVGSSAEKSNRSASLHNSLWYAPFVTAQAWAIVDGYTGALLYGAFEGQSREVASLTKIATCILALRHMSQDPSLSKSSIIPVSRAACSMPGTSARLREGDELYLWDALYGMMLPSGNDAAYCIAEFLGRRIRERKGEDGSEKSAVSFFVKEMNDLSRDLGLSSTFFANPHGLPNAKNKSSARDIGILAFAAMQNPIFASIVATEEYSCYISQKSSALVFRRVKWTNTNRLLAQGWEGVKTGITVPAGPCLCACISRGGAKLIITILGSRTMDKRWEEVEKLAKWAITRRNSQPQ